MKLSLFTFEFTPEELKNLDLDKYVKQALIDGTKETKDEPEIISKDNSAESDTKNLLPDKTPDKIGYEMGERIANKLAEYSKDMISDTDTDSKPCFTDLFSSSTDSEQCSNDTEVSSDMVDMKEMDDIIKQIREQLNYKIGDTSDEDDEDNEQE